jgi:hypothetical protein
MKRQKINSFNGFATSNDNGQTLASNGSMSFTSLQEFASVRSNNSLAYRSASNEGSLATDSPSFILNDLESHITLSALGTSCRYVCFKKKLNLFDVLKIHLWIFP